MLFQKRNNTKHTEMLCLLNVTKYCLFRMLTMSPGLTETATTVPGIGDLRMLLVSSSTFSGMYLFSSAACFGSTCSLY